MFKISENNGNNMDYLELKSPNSTTYAKIHLSQGGSLQELTLNNKTIIKDLSSFYETSFASAILFPFTNRIKNGTYTFNEKKYTLDPNLKKENNAIHGLVYNKLFKLVHKEVTENMAKVTMEYSETEKKKGFPYNYTIQLSYTLTLNDLTLNIAIKNDDQEAFPFNVGWHPYFNSSNLYNSILSLNSHKKLLFNKEMIPIKIDKITPVSSFQIKDSSFDDCFILNSNKVSFETPDYHLDILSTSEDNYLQVYTPSTKNSIALEPITGPGNSFNNKLSLQILNPDDTYEVSWKLKLSHNE